MVSYHEYISLTEEQKQEMSHWNPKNTLSVRCTDLKERDIFFIPGKNPAYVERFSKSKKTLYYKFIRSYDLIIHEEIKTNDNNEQYLEKYWFVHPDFYYDYYRSRYPCLSMRIKENDRKEKIMRPMVYSTITYNFSKHESYE